MKTVINVHTIVLTIEFGDRIIQFSTFDETRQPIEEHSILRIDVSTSQIEDSLSDFYAELPELVNSDDFVGFSCVIGDGDNLRPMCVLRLMHV